MTIPLRNVIAHALFLTWMGAVPVYAGVDETVAPAQGHATQKAAHKQFFPLQQQGNRRPLFYASKPGAPNAVAKGNHASRKPATGTLLPDQLQAQEILAIFVGEES